MLRELTEAVHSRQVSATELVKRALERIERFNGPLNAVVALRAEEALREAHDLDARLAAEAPAGASAASRASRSCASRSASSARRATTAFSGPLNLSIRSSARLTSSVAETCRE